jgi:hypothetical protein
MQNETEISVNVATFITENGIEIYIGEGDLPILVDLEEDVEEFLNDICDGDGKVYDEISEELQAVINIFRKCLQKLENAKR